jgi:hypothetical protein
MFVAPDTFLTPEDWDELLLDIQNRQVIPIVGPELVTIEHDGARVPLTRWLAPRLAENLKLPNAAKFTGLNKVACAYLLTEKSDRLNIYKGVRRLLHDLRFEPPPALLQLAQITDFDLFISSTFDPLLALALEDTRPAFDRTRCVLAYDTKPGAPFPDPLPPSLVYHILGNLDTHPDFAVWEEDYMEHLCALIGQSGDESLEGLFRQLKRRHLLLLGAPFEDWIVRFFIRTARGSRLSEKRVHGSGEYLADKRRNVGRRSVFFFNNFAKATRVVEGDPGAFVAELFTRWQRSRNVSGSAREFVDRLPAEMPRNAVFISYASEDREGAFRIAVRLAGAGVPVWLDKQRLQAGGNYERNLEHAVREECSFFVSVISAHTEAAPRDAAAGRYFHKERGWAASRYHDGFAFYIPVIVDDTASSAVRQEPPCFEKIQRVALPDGEPTVEFCRRVRQLVESWRTSGRPRD